MAFGKEKEVENTEEIREDEKSERELAEEKLAKWARALELDTERELFKDILDKLTGVVMNGNLDFDEDSEVFTYKLIKPVGSSGNKKTLVTIKETDFNDKKSLQKFKEHEEMEAAGMMMSKHTNLTTGEVLQLKTRDQKRLNAVIMGFLSQ